MLVTDSLSCMHLMHFTAHGKQLSACYFWATCMPGPTSSIIDVHSRSLKNISQICADHFQSWWFSRIWNGHAMSVEVGQACMWPELTGRKPAFHELWSALSACRTGSLWLSMHMKDWDLASKRHWIMTLECWSRRLMMLGSRRHLRVP